MSDNNFLDDIFKSKKKKKSPLEKFIKTDSNEEDVSKDKETKPGVGIEHYGTSSSSSASSSVDNYQSKHQSSIEKKEKIPGQLLLDASGLKEFNIDSFDTEIGAKPTPEQQEIAKNNNDDNNMNAINIDEINKLISFLKVGNYDAAVDFIIQLKLKYNIDNIL